MKNGDEGIPLENQGLFAFFYLLYFLRLKTGGDVGNFYEVEMGNQLFDVKAKVTIKRALNDTEIQIFAEIIHDFGLDIDDFEKQCKERGLVPND